jgi:histidinol-phosphate aminotransferase
MMTTPELPPEVAALIEALVRDELRATEAYEVPHPGGITAKLDANELPWALPDAVASELGRELATVPMHRYPAPDQPELRALLAGELGLAPAQVLLGNGSDEIIQLLVCCFARPRAGQHSATIAFPSPTFTLFRAAALAAGCEPVEIPVQPEEDFALDPDALDRVVRARRPNLVFLARPNNPTGTLWPSSTVLELARAHPDVLVVSDEAYSAYAGDGMVDRLAEAPNLLVMQTLSKIGLAALRVGLLAGAPGLVAEVNKVRSPYNVGALNQRAALWLLRHHRPLLAARCAQVVRERDRVARALAALPGVRPFTSHANLVLFRIGAPGDGRATAVWEELCRRGVLVRCLDRPGPLAGCLRVTIGTPAENDAFVAGLTAALASPAGLPPGPPG